MQATDEGTKQNQFDLLQFVYKFRWQTVLFLGGLILLGVGVFYSQKVIFSSPKVEVINSTGESIPSGQVVVEVSGEVEKPGVYELDEGSRVEDALIAAGGVSAQADRDWMAKVLNRASKLIDGQKIYIPKVGEGAASGVSTGGSQDSQGLVNINTATLSQLESLPGIGPVYGQSIIDHRPYSGVEELYEKGVLKKNVYEKIKDKVTVY